MRGERLQLGAHITDVKSDNKQITETLIKEMTRVAAEVSRRPDHWYCDQLRNHDAIRGYLPSIRVAERLGRDATVVTIAVDSGSRYLSTDLYGSG